MGASPGTLCHPRTCRREACPGVSKRESVRKLSLCGGWGFHLSFLSLLLSIFALSGKFKLLLVTHLHAGRCWSTHHHCAQPPLGKLSSGTVLKWKYSLLVCVYGPLLHLRAAQGDQHSAGSSAPSMFHPCKTLPLRADSYRPSVLSLPLPGLLSQCHWPLLSLPHR